MAVLLMLLFHLLMMVAAHPSHVWKVQCRGPTFPSPCRTMSCESSGDCSIHTAARRCVQCWPARLAFTSPTRVVHPRTNGSLVPCHLFLPCVSPYGQNEPAFQLTSRRSGQ